MNRREEWDRDWEWRYKPFRGDNPDYEPERRTLLDEKDREGQSRLAWDEQHRDALTTQTSSRPPEEEGTPPKQPAVRSDARGFRGFLRRYRGKAATA